MDIEVKGHSGCEIEIRKQGNQIFLYKKSKDPKYLLRLVRQAEKQKKAAAVEDYYHIRVPQIYNISHTQSETIIQMQYIYSKNFVEFLEQAGFEQIGYFIDAMKHFIEYEIERSPIQKVQASVFQNKFKEVKSKIERNLIYEGNRYVADLLLRCQDVFDNMCDMEIPVGICHGDLTLSNILFNGNNYYLIDFLDSFIETPLQDIVKLRQDTSYRWSQLMYKHNFDTVRLKIICDKIDSEINSYFSEKYEWYSKNYQIMQLMNILRIFPYASDASVVDYLISIVSDVLSNKQKEKETALQNIKEDTDNDDFTLIVPIAADKEEYEHNIPPVFRIAEDGSLLCIKSILGMNLSCFNKIYFTILKKLDEQYSLSERLLLQFKIHGLNNAEIVVLDRPTSSQPETIYQTIRQRNITGSIFIKDADCYLEGEVSRQNSLAIYPLESLKWVNPQDKSYVSVDDMFYVTNIIEKRIVSHYFTAGGYCFENASQYCAYYKSLAGQKGIYLSHIVYAMLLDGYTFRPIKINKYIDFQ